MRTQQKKVLVKKLRAFERRRRDFMAGWEYGRAALCNKSDCFKEYARRVISKEELLEDE